MSTCESPSQNCNCISLWQVAPEICRINSFWTRESKILLFITNNRWYTRHWDNEATFVHTQKWLWRRDFCDGEKLRPPMPITKTEGYNRMDVHTIRYSVNIPNNCLNNLLEKCRGQGPTAYEQSIFCSKTIMKNNFRFLDCIILANHCLNTHALLLLSIKRTLNVCDFSLGEVYCQIPTFSSSLEMSMSRFMFMVPFFIYVEKFDHPPPTYYLK